MRNARRNHNHITFTHSFLDPPRVVFVPEAKPSFAVRYAQNFVGRCLRVSD